MRWRWRRQSRLAERTSAGIPQSHRNIKDSSRGAPVCANRPPSDNPTCRSTRVRRSGCPLIQIRSRLAQKCVWTAGRWIRFGCQRPARGAGRARRGSTSGLVKWQMRALVQSWRLMHGLEVEACIKASLIAHVKVPVPPGKLGETAGRAAKVPNSTQHVCNILWMYDCRRRPAAPPPCRMCQRAHLVGGGGDGVRGVHGELSQPPSRMPTSTALTPIVAQLLPASSAARSPLPLSPTARPCLRWLFRPARPP